MCKVSDRLRWAGGILGHFQEAENGMQILGYQGSTPLMMQPCVFPRLWWHEGFLMEKKGVGLGPWALGPRG